MSRLKQALDKAKAGQGPTEPVVERPMETPLPKPFTQAPEEKPPTDDVNPIYSRTNVVRASRKDFQENRIVSLCHDHVVGDQIKLLQTQVLSEMARIPGNTVLVTSPRPAEGKTITSLNIAISISHKLDRTVLLVEANLKAPTIRKYLGLPEGPGLADYLLGEAELPDLFVNPGIEKLVLLPAGRPLPNSAEVLGSPRMESLVKEMKTRYPDRFLIFDSPSLLTCADALVLSRFMDGILLIVQDEKTPARDLERSLELLKGRKIIGTVLNKARYH